MYKSNNRRLVHTILISGFSVLISYAINFFITPYITENLGVDAYGFVSIANTAVGYAGIITIALTSFVVRYISVSFHEGKLNEANSYFSSSVEACIALSITILFVAAIVTLRLDQILKIPDPLVQSVKFLFTIVFVNFTVTTITTPFGTAAYIKNRLDLSGLVRIVTKIVEAVVILLLFVFIEPNVWFVAVGTLCASIVNFIGSYTMTIKLTPELQFSHKLSSIGKVKDLVTNGVWNSFNQLGNILNSGLDLIISNLMLTGTETGQIAVAKTIGTIFTTLFQTVSQPFQPLLIKSYASGVREDFLKELSKAMRACGFLGALSFAGFVALGKLYFKLWLPSQDYILLYELTILTVFNHITDSILRPVYYISTLTLKNKMPCWVTIGGGFINVIVMYSLIKSTNLGVYAVVITTAFIMVGINLLFNPLYAAKCICIKSSFFYKIILKHLIVTCVMIITFMAEAYIFNADNWIGLIINIFLMIITGALIYMVTMCNKSEKKMILKKLKNKARLS